MSQSVSEGGEAPVSLGWGRFALRLVGCLAWMAVAGFAARQLIDAPPGPAAWAWAALGFAPLLVAQFLFQRWLGQADEMQTRLELVTVAQGGWWALLYGVIMAGLNAHNDGPLLGLIFMAPAGGAAFAVGMSQFQRCHMARRERRG